MKIIQPQFIFAVLELDLKFHVPFFRKTLFSQKLIDFEFEKSYLVTFDNVFEMYGMLELLHVHVIRCDVQDGSDRLRQLHGKHLGFRAQLVGSVETACVACKVVLVPTVESHVQSGAVVILRKKISCRMRREKIKMFEK